MAINAKNIEEWFTFDDVSLIPNSSMVLLKDVEVSTQFTKTIRLKFLWSMPPWIRSLGRGLPSQWPKKEELKSSM